MKLAFVVPGDIDQASGGYRYDRQVAGQLGERGWDVDVIEGPINQSDPVCPVIESLVGGSYDLVLQDELAFGPLRTVNQAIETPVISLIHLLQRTDPAASEASLRNEAAYLEAVDGYVCTSRTTWKELGSVTDPYPGIVAYPGRDPLPAVTPERNQQGPLQLAFVGHVRPIKGLPTVLRAIANTEVPMALTVVGSRTHDPDHTRDLEDLIDSLGIDDAVEFTGALPHEEVTGILERSSVLVGPSRYEAFGMAYLEAMTHGVVPIGSTAGGATELIEHGRTGFLVDPGDVTALSEILKALHRDRQACLRIARAARDRASVHPTWQTSMDDMHRFLQSVACTTS